MFSTKHVPPILILYSFRDSRIDERQSTLWRHSPSFQYIWLVIQVEYSPKLPGAMSPFTFGEHSVQCNRHNLGTLRVTTPIKVQSTRSNLEALTFLIGSVSFPPTAGSFRCTRVVCTRTVGQKKSLPHTLFTPWPWMSVSQRVGCFRQDWT